MTLVTITVGDRVWKHAVYDKKRICSSLEFLDESGKEVHIVGMPYVIEEE